MARRKRPWNRRVGRPSSWRSRRGFWWAPAAADPDSSGASPTTSAIDSCFTPFTSVIPDPTGTPSVLVIPILWNVAQNLSDTVVDQLDTSFGDFSGPGRAFQSFRHRPESERWRVERISGHFTIEGANNENNATFGANLVHMGILVTETDEDSLVIERPSFNSSALKPWVWKDQFPIVTTGRNLDASSGFMLSGIQSVCHRTINVKTRRALKPETVINLIVELDTPPESVNQEYFFSAMLRAYVTRTA